MSHPNILDNITRALKLLQSHTPVAIPTETVYGLAAPVSDLKAIQSVFTIKERPLFDPLIVHVNSLEMAKRYTLSWPPLCDLLSQAFWPGPLTIVLPKNHLIHDLITSGRPNVGLRIPRQETTLKLIELLGEGLAAPSANKFKRTSPTCAQHVVDQFGEQVPVLDDGECSVGIESTVCGIDEEKKELLIYRPGLCHPNDIIALLQQHGEKRYRIQYQRSLDAPGQESTHYCPLYPLVVYTKESSREIAREAAQKKWGERNHVFSSLPQNPLLAARILYKKLQDPKIDPNDILLLYAPICKMDHSWIAIKDRLKKAASLFLDDE